MKNKIIILFLLSSLFFACNNSRLITPPENLISKDSLISILIDMHIVDGQAFQLNTPGSSFNFGAESLYESVINKHGTTRAIFDSSINYYMKYPEDFEIMYESVIIELSKIEGELKRDTATIN
ncbi:DUF4296 domain-containing protein [Bacteroidota bacterium]